MNISVALASWAHESSTVPANSGSLSSAMDARERRISFSHLSMFLIRKLGSEIPTSTARHACMYAHQIHLTLVHLTGDAFDCRIAPENLCHTSNNKVRKK